MGFAKLLISYSCGKYPLFHPGPRLIIKFMINNQLSIRAF